MRKCVCAYVRRLQKLSLRARRLAGVAISRVRVRDCFVALLLAMTSVVTDAHAVPLAPQQLAKGQSTTIPTDYLIGDVAITDQAVCDYFVKDSRREVYLNAKKPGMATLTLWDQQGVKRDVIPVQVTPVDLNELATAAGAGSGGNGRLRLRQEGDEVIVEGEVASEAELARVQSVVVGRPGVRAAVQLGPKALADLAGQVERAIGRPGISVRRIKQRLVLEGVAYSAEAYAHAEKIARIFDTNILNLLEVRDTKRTPGKRPLVILDVYLMEVKKSALRRFGISWTPGASVRGDGSGQGAEMRGGGGPLGGIGDLFGSAVGFVFNLLPKLQFARERGLARVLEHPTMVVKSGEPVDFFSGTEVPYFSAQNVQFKEVGIKLQAEPIAYGDDIDLKITARLSSPSSGVRQGIDTRSITTSAYCKNGQSIVLGGLWHNGDAKSFHRVPDGLDTSSALFTLALSRDFQSNQSDFVIFVTPRIADRPPPAEPVLEEWLRLDDAVTKARSKKEKKRAASPNAVIAMPSSLQSSGGPP